MAAYKHIIFDLDHTLWDFDTNCAETLEEIFEKYENKFFKGIKVLEFVETYKKVNQQMWDDYHKNVIDRAELKTKRFSNTFQLLGFKNDFLATILNEEFIKICPTKTNLLPFAKDVLDYLKEKYTLHILTNGFKESQYLKINNSGIAHYFLHVILSETLGLLKPDKGIFDHAVTMFKAQRNDCIMVGDDLVADVLGAKNAGMDHVYFNKGGVKHSENIQFEIKCLTELKHIL